MSNLHREMRVLSGFEKGSESDPAIDFSSRKSFARSVRARAEHWMKNGTPIGMHNTVLPPGATLTALTNAENPSDVHYTTDVAFVGAPFAGICGCCIGRSSHRTVIDGIKLSETTADALTLPEEMALDNRALPNLELTCIAPLSLVDVETSVAEFNKDKGKDVITKRQRLFRVCMWCANEMITNTHDFVRLSKAMNPKVKTPKKTKRDNKPTLRKPRNPVSEMNNYIKHQRIDVDMMASVLDIAGIAVRKNITPQSFVDVLKTMTLNSDDAMDVAGELLNYDNQNDVSDDSTLANYAVVSKEFEALKRSGTDLGTVCKVLGHYFYTIAKRDVKEGK